MDLSLSQAVRKAVREWVDAVVAPHALGNDREERFPVEALDGLRQTGFIGNPGGVRRRWGRPRHVRAVRRGTRLG
ncbi:hypothetical protein LI90_1578 [Carbonactinospora thermoautotrophica]|uniref:Acyl-CoA dehydrogenase/oxidase N-terminal domain-containing protein n=1 Tax=Carbonactinospora thermoautotrophica TaxID=1469144 RepID=A0A132MQ12_9ACTN|nr:acyl-CoA dehydrogenase family protein [Carbonactinospora thermoautotrophica]KWW99938.1 hypothetical protein LI90_1578 [Carbonactinospora thermoautotrophica]